jgi:hypothetical protein
MQPGAQRLGPLAAVGPSCEFAASRSMTGDFALTFPAMLAVAIADRRQPDGLVPEGQLHDTCGDQDHGGQQVEPQSSHADLAACGHGRAVQQRQRRHRPGFLAILAAGDCSRGPGCRVRA